MKNLHCSPFLIVFCALSLSQSFLNSCSHSDSINNMRVPPNGQNQLQQSKDLEKYKLEVAFKVANIWTLPDDPNISPKMQTRIAFRVMPNGNIQNISIVKSSGNEALDNSALNAVKMASPVKPFPNTISAPYIDMGLTAKPTP